MMKRKRTEITQVANFVASFKKPEKKERWNIKSINFYLSTHALCVSHWFMGHIYLTKFGVI